MVYFVEAASDGFDESLKNKKPSEISKTLEKYLSDNFSKEELKNINEPKFFYEITYNKPGGLVMPIIVEYTYVDGTTKTETFPAQIWRLNDKEVSRVVASDKEIVKITVDPKEETADIDTTNNIWPPQEQKSEFDQFKSSGN